VVGDELQLGVGTHVSIDGRWLMNGGFCVHLVQAMKNLQYPDCCGLAGEECASSFLGGDVMIIESNRSMIIEKVRYL
jgi:hypothetical protein